MTSFRFLGATLVLSALLATPASAWSSASEPAAAASQDPTFSIYSNNGRGYSDGSGYSAYGMVPPASLGDASGLYRPVRPHRGNHAAGVKRY
jgi:hypothetical protein